MHLICLEFDKFTVLRMAFVSIIGLAGVFSPLNEVVVECIVPTAQPSLTYGRSAFLSLASLSLSFYFSTIWKYSQLNLEELRGRAVPTFPCLKFPSNGVIHSLSFPFYT